MTLKSLLNYWDQPPLVNADTRALWADVMAMPDISTPIASRLLNRPIILNGYSRIKKTSLLPQTRFGSRKPASYLPIEFFKSYAEEFFHSKEPATKIFHSSGTTAEHVSRSHFSADGLELYKLGSLKTFYEVLADVFCQNPVQVRGVSLVPKTSEWPNSSLAQMVSWISEFSEVTYCTPEQLACELDVLTLKSNEPLWIFGTASYFIAAMEQSVRLPKGSVLIETGGAKGLAQKFSRRQLYMELCDHFDLPHTSIISEYGMCELASQAYDWVSPKSGSAVEFEHRQFRFPGWVATHVTQGLRHATEAGAGALIVHDPLRIDYPWPIRTQDLASLDFKQRFCLNGRVPHAPIKGCSLIDSQKAQRIDAPFLIEEELWNVDREDVVRRAQLFSESFERFCKDPVVIQQMAKEIGSLSAAKNLLAQTLSAGSLTSEQWLSSVFRSLGANAKGETVAPRHWLFVAPANHAVASFQPLALGYVAGLTIGLRMPQRFDSCESVLHMFYSFVCNLHDAAIYRINSSTRLGATRLDRDIEAVLFFGSDETLEEIRNYSSVPVQAFGSARAVSFVDLDCPSSEIDAVVTDAFSLGQKGCMSSRLVITLADHPTVSRENFSAAIQKSFRSFWKESLTVGQRCALDCEEIYLRQSGHANFIREQYDDILIPFYQRDSFDMKRETVECSIPVLTLESVTKKNLHENIVSVIKDLASVKFAYLPKQYLNDALLMTKLQHLLPSVTFAANGSSNNLSWNGMHEKRPLFLLT
jgi:hypothetical protein